MKKLILAMLFTVLLVFGVLPGAALAADADSDGYNDYDVAKIHDFLVQTPKEPETSNALLLSYTDVNDPDTWTPGITWVTVEGEKRVESIDWSEKDMGGDLDLSGCTSLVSLNCSNGDAIMSLNVSGCTALSSINCSGNYLDTNPNLAGCSGLKTLIINNNGGFLTDLDLHGQALLEHLECSNSYLESLNVTGCAALNFLDCSNNALSSLDVSDSTSLTTYILTDNPLKEIKADIGGQSVTLAANGNGTVNMYDFLGDIRAWVPDASPSVFVNWTENGSQVSTNNPYTIPGGDHTLTANFASYITYNGNGADWGTAPEGAAYIPGASVTLPGNTGSLGKRGYTFTGWNTATDGSGTHYDAGAAYTMPDGPVTLYAEWKRSFTITYYNAGATSGSVPVSSTVCVGETATISGNTGGLKKTGYVFNGWNTQIQGTGTHYSAGQTFAMPASDLTLYAEWKENYNAHDVAKIQAFLAQGSNAAALGADLGAPDTWKVEWVMSGNEWYVQRIIWKDKSLSGSLDLSYCSLLDYMYLDNNNLSGINVNGCSSLYVLLFNKNNISSIDLTGLSNLFSINCAGNKLTSLNLNGLNKLGIVGCEDNALGSLDVSCCPEMEFVFCSNCSLSSLNINGCNKLSILECANNSLTSLNVSPVLTEVDCRYNPMTQINLNIKGGNDNVLPMSFSASGPGYVGFYYIYKNAEAHKAYAESINLADFTGWTRNGSSFSNSYMCDITEGGAYVASFAYNKGPMLANVGLSAGSLSPKFSPWLYKYKIQLGENDAGVTITPEKMFSGLGMTINKQNVPSLWVPVAAGKSATVSVVVTQGKAKKTYTFTVTRPKSSNNYLSSLSAAGTWSQPFDANVMNYTLYLDENTKSTVIKAAAVPGFGAKVSPASAKVTLNNGAYKDVKITVKAQSGAKRVYTIHVVRAASTNADLKSLKAPGLKFSTAQTNYTVTLPANKSSVSISAKAAGYKATVSINGGKASAKLTLANGETKTVRVVVTSQAGNTKEYAVTVTRQ